MDPDPTFTDRPAAAARDGWGPLATDRRRLWLIASVGGATVFASGCSVQPEQFAGWLEASSGHPAAPLVAIALFVASGFVAAPLSAVMLPTLVIFGPVAGSLWTIIGATLSATLFFQLGATGSAVMRRFAGRFSGHRKLNRFLEEDGILAVAIARNLPLAPYPVVNLALGASPVRFDHFLIGNSIGLLPWILLYAAAGSQLRRLLAEPSLDSALWTVLGFLALIGATLLGARAASRWLVRRRPTGDQRGP